MEKYSGWRDPGTGIHPFLPPKPPRKDDSVLTNVVLALKCYAIGPPLAIIKLLIIVVLVLLITLLELISNVLIVPEIKHAWRKLVYGLLGRTVLFVCGFWWIPTTPVSLHRGGRKAQSARNSHASKHSKVDIYIANHSSYFDLLYFQCKLAPVFLHVSLNGNVRQLQFAEAMQLAGEYPRLDDSMDKLDLISFIKKCADSPFTPPIVLFPEGTTSNGRGLLKFMPIFSKMNSEELGIQFHIVGLKYIYDQWCPCYTVGGKLSHFFWSLTQFVNTLNVRELSPHETVISLDPLAEGAISDGEDLVGSQLSTLLAQVLRIRKTSKDVADKCDFLDFYNERKNKRYVRKK
ncbi:hypothetical protein BASA62_006163 [Batrachochytrium salamandrivorans]|nr:hypothetical protein BASA62_006163 [Batrachochytrium salamandrivorans]